MENLRAKLVAALFASHAGVNVFHLTSDDQAFVEDHHADAHSKSLTDKTVEVFERRDYETHEVVNLPAKEKKDATVVKASATDKDAEKAELQAEYLKLFGEKANHMTGVVKLKTAIDAKKLEIAEAAKNAEGAGESTGTEGAQGE